MNEPEVTKTSSASHAPDEVRKFAEAMGRVQGCRVVLAREVSGYHLYIPCPECLELHGRRELADPKYAINVSKHLALGDSFKSLRDTGFAFDTNAMNDKMGASRERDEKSGICMRTRQSKNPHRFSIQTLKNMQTVTQRHPDLMTRTEIVGQTGSAEREDHWEIDPASGVKCPPPPGEVIPIYDLPENHPARSYLTNRGYDLHKLWDQFRCSFCVKEYTEGTNGIYYRKMPGGWKDTPQNRIIFYSMVSGAPMTWQARYPETVSNEGRERYMWHPYDSTWSHVGIRANSAATWMPVAPYDETDSNGAVKFQPSKYRTAKYSSRQMMGWDAALDRSVKDPDMMKWCVLCEGPLDAARVGPGGIALIGSSISPDNAALVAKHFHFVFTAFDTDLAGRSATEKVGKMLLSTTQRNSVVVQVVPLPIVGGKDLGDMTQDAFDKMFSSTLKKTKRGNS